MDNFHYDFSAQQGHGVWKTHSETNGQSNNNSNSMENNVSGESKENSTSNSGETNGQKDYKYGPNNDMNATCSQKKEEKKTTSNIQGSSDNSNSFESKDQRNSD